MQSKLYRKWSSMHRRCNDPKHPSYAYYGGRGLSVCAEWTGKGGFIQFSADLGDVPDGHWLERIDNSQGYSKSNCRWATPKEQAANRRPKPPNDLNSLRQRCLRAGLDYHAVYLRINRLKWDEAKALSTPIAKRGRAPFIEQELKPMRRKRGWSPPV